MNVTERQKSELEFARRIGVIQDFHEDSIVSEIEEYNLKDRELLYGKTSFDSYSYIRYKLAKFRMDFVFEKLEYEYRQIKNAEIEQFYQDNKALFLRENGEYFPLSEVHLVIKKRLREREYEEAINGVLR